MSYRAPRALTLTRRTQQRNIFLLTAPFATPRGRLPRPRRARRVLARGWRILGGAVQPARLSRRALLVKSGRSPNWPATPRECSLGSSAPTRRRCVILGCLAPCPSRGTSLQPSRLAHRSRVHAKICDFAATCPPLRKNMPAQRLRRRASLPKHDADAPVPEMETTVLATRVTACTQGDGAFPPASFPQPTA